MWQKRLSLKQLPRSPYDRSSFWHVGSQYHLQFQRFWESLPFPTLSSIKWDWTTVTNRQIQRSSFGFISWKSIWISVIQNSKVLEWKQQFVTSFRIKYTWQTPVDNCEKGFRKEERDCTKFAFHQCSANSKSSEKIDWINPKPMYGMSWRIAVVQLT